MKQIKNKDINRPVTSSLPLEERIRVIANLIVDQIIEAQRTATLQVNNQTNKEE